MGQFGTFQDVSRRFGTFRAFWDVLGCFETFWDNLGHIMPFGDILGRFGMSWDVLAKRQIKPKKIILALHTDRFASIRIQENTGIEKVNLKVITKESIYLTIIFCN